jgi:galactokinase
VTRSFRAPGRVNLIGGQVDYHEGFVVSMAIDRDVVVRARPRDDGVVSARSAEFAGTVSFDTRAPVEAARVEPAWGRLVAAVAQVLAERGVRLHGADLAYESSLTPGAGLSSSAAFEVVTTLALADLAGVSLSVNDAARVAQRAEHAALGVPCGIQDQLTSLAARAGHVVLLDCRTLAVEHLSLPHTLAVLVVHSGVARTLEGSPWAARRAESFEAAQRLGVRVLRDATAAQVEHEPRARHVVNEIARVLAFADALRRGDVDSLGALLLASHASSRDDMAVSIPALDALVECLVEAGALGARLTGGGFGGCVVALAPADTAEDVLDRACAAYRARTAREPTPWLVQPSEGAGPLVS